MSKTREIIAYMVIAALGAALIVAGLFLPGVPKGVVTKSDIRTALGSPAVKSAEQTIQAQASQAGVVITKMSVDHVAVKGGKTVVYLVVQTAQIGTVRLAVTLTKSVYQVTSVQRVS